MSSIINLNNKTVESLSNMNYPDNWYEEGWIAVPPEFENIISNNAPFVDFTVTEGVISNVTILEKPTMTTKTNDIQMLQAQLKAQTDRADFLEDCIAEMAIQLYT